MRPALLWLAAFGCGTSAAADERPNVIVVVVDDMGFSDLGCYGSEIDTPRIDALAHGGLRFTQFYNCAKCETTRACLLSGRYHGEVGVGKLQNCATIAEVMRGAGYTTLMAGKWHQTGNPVERGFDRYFGHLSGACNFFKGDNSFRLDDQPFEVPKSGFYTTDANTDYALKFLRERPQDKPFLLYLAYNAPHYPLHAPRKEVEKYRGKYRGGWDRLRQTRLARMKQLGIVDERSPLTPRPDDVPAWDSLSKDKQDVQELCMAAYAGMIDRVDQNVGRLVDYLREDGQLDNTLILFFSDNGACPFQRTTPVTRDKMLMPWNPESYWTYDKGWAHACNTPFREYKRNQHEGGISTAMIAHWPDAIERPGTITRQPGHLVDVMATCIDLGKADYPKTSNGKPVGPYRGRSLRPIFAGQTRPPAGHLFFTFYGTHNALRVGDWKLVNKDNGPWELYDLSQDRSELRDRAVDSPQKLSEMKGQFQQLLEQYGTGRTKKPRKNSKNKNSKNKNSKNKNSKNKNSKSKSSKSKSD